jgi:hypothetical protein
LQPKGSVIGDGELITRGSVAEKVKSVRITLRDGFVWRSKVVKG